MTFMKFRLGLDLGSSLIKAIACSLLTVFLFMPSLLMIFGRAMDKTKHRRFVPKISFVGKIAYATRYVFPIIFVALVIGAYHFFGQTYYAYAQDIVPAMHMTERETANAEIVEKFGGSNIVALIIPSGDYAAEMGLAEELSACEEVKSVTGLASVEIADGLRLGDFVGTGEFASLAGVDETTADALFAYYAAEKGDHHIAEDDLAAYRAPLVDLFLFLHDRLEAGDVELSGEQAELVNSLYGQLSLLRVQLQSERYSRLVLDLDLPAQSDETFAFLDRLHLIGSTYYDEGVVLTGDSVSALGFKESFASDNRVVGLMSLALVMLILFFTFKSFGMPLLLILVIQGSIWMNFAIASLQGTPVFFLCYLIVSAIQMGANIDYAIVVSTRYRELRETMDQKEAIITTLNLAFPTVITSGLMMVCAGLLGGFRVSQCIIAGMGYYVGTGTSISLVLVLFALPQLLLLGDRFVAVTTISTEGSRLLGFFRRKAHRFAALLLSAAAILALLAAPLGIQDGSRYARQTKEQTAGILAQTAELKTLAEKLDAEREQYDALKYKFAEQLVTDEVGAQLLEEGEAQYQEGLEKYTEGKTQYDEGKAQLEDAKEQYDAGAAKLAAGQAAYDAGLAQYNAGVAQYNAGQQQLAEGQAAYDAGLAQYNAGKAEYAAGQQKLAEGQAAYDAGLAAYEQGKAEYAAGQQKLAEGQAAYDAGLAQYNQSKAQYDQAKALLDSISGLYNTVLPLYNEYQNAEAQYDEAVANGDPVEILRLSGVVIATKLAFESQLGGYSIGGLMQEYQNAQAQLNDAAAQLAEGEAQLAAGKAELDEGYAAAAAAEAQLAAAEQQLAEGKAELDAGYAAAAEAERQLAAAEKELNSGKAELDAGYAAAADGEAQLAAARAQLAAGKAQLDAGYAELGEAGVQIEEGDAQLAEAHEQLAEGEAKLNEVEEQLKTGRETLAENREQLNSSLEALDSYNSEAEKLTEGVKLLMENDEVKSLAGYKASTLEVLNAAERTVQDAVQDARRQADAARWICLWLLLAAGLGLLSVMLWVLLHMPFPAALSGILCAVAALLSIVYWRGRCGDLTPAVTAAGVLLAVFGLLFAQLVYHIYRETKTAEEADPA